jgi:DNA-directed RNA polymerase subunit RPC12/RpoP
MSTPPSDLGFIECPACGAKGYWVQSPSKQGARDDVQTYVCGDCGRHIELSAKADGKK